MSLPLELIIPPKPDQIYEFMVTKVQFTRLSTINYPSRRHWVFDGDSTKNRPE